jgi:hypothetical protein
MIKFKFSFLPTQDMLLGVNLDHGSYKLNSEDEPRTFNRLKIGLIFCNFQFLYLM